MILKKAGLLLTSRNFILIMAIIIGLLLGDKVSFLKALTPYIIGLILAVSTSSFHPSIFLPPERNISPALYCFILNYLAFGLILLGLASWLNTDQELWTGYVIIAATPPAIAIIPFTINLKGDGRFSIIGVFINNMLGIFLTPLIIFLLLGSSSVSPCDLILILLKMLVIPLFVSRLFRIKSIYPFIDKYRGIIIDYGFFLVALTVIGLSRSLFFTHPEMLIIPFAIFIFIMIILGSIFKYVVSRFYPDKGIVMSLSLMLTVKNAGFAAVVAITLFEPVKVVLAPAVLSVMLTVLYLYESNIGYRFLRSGN